MREKICAQLWVAKFSLKIIYPKYNFYLFLVFLAIKCRIYYNRTIIKGKMETYSVRTVPSNTLRLLVKEYAENQLPIVFHKCLVISREQFVQLCAENLFYADNGVLWLAMKLTQSTKRNHYSNTKTSSHWKSNLGLVTSQIHKKLWTDKHLCSTNNIRIVPVVGSKAVENNIIFTLENEFLNIASCYNMTYFHDIEVTFHPVPSLDNSPKIAATAEVSLIVNDYDLSNDFIKEILSNHYELPKLLSINDVFSIELTPDITARYHFKYLDLVEAAGKLYFRCNKITSDNEITSKSCTNIIQPYYVIKGVTQLTLGENIHMRKPKDEYFKTVEGTQKTVQFLQLCPLGLKKKFDQIQETISPFMTGELNDLSSSLTSPLIPMFLLTGSVGSGRHLLVKTLAKYNGMNCLQIDCNVLQSSTAKQTESKINSTIQKAKASAPTIVLLDNFEVFAVDPENNEDCRVTEYFMNTITDLYQNYTKHPIIFIAITERVDLKPNILRMFLEKYHIPKLNPEQRYQMLEWFASVMGLNLLEDEDASSEITTGDSGGLSIKTKEILQRVAAKTETFIYGDLDTLVHFAIRESYLKQLSQPSDPDMQTLKEEDFNTALESIRSLQSQHLDAPKIPKVFWEDIGGLDKLKKELLKTIEFPIKYPHLFKNSSLKRSGRVDVPVNIYFNKFKGILLYGPPGCGKTLVAKAVSTELNVSFLSVKGPELLNMYIGQSEENVRKVFSAARAAAPCIVFLDELDALAPRRGAAGDSGGASDRVVSQLLAELDGVAGGDDADTSSLVFIMGATNRPDLLEQSLLRPGRLDKLVYVGPYCGAREKAAVLAALCRSHKVREEVQLATVAAALPARCTGADLLQVVGAARANAVRALLERVRAGLVKESELSLDSVVLGVADLWHGVETFRPSVSDEELAYYESLQHQM